MVLTDLKSGSLGNQNKVGFGKTETMVLIIYFTDIQKSDFVLVSKGTIFKFR